MGNVSRRPADESRLESLYLNTKPGLLHKAPFYPLLLGLYPILYLWLANVYQIPASVVTFPLLISLGISVAAFALALLLLRNLRKAAAVAGVFLVLFFAYGRIFDLIEKWQVAGILLGRHRYLMAVWLLIFIALAVLLIRSRSNFLTLTWLANLVTAFLLLLTVGQLAYAEFGAARATPATLPPSSAPKLAALDPKTLANSPDVYYIVLDGHDREDLLQQDTGLNDHAFIAQLEQLGFVVPACTQSNYNTTVFSVAGTFNMNYLDALGFSYSDLAKAAYGIEFSTPELEASIHANPVMQLFKAMGYQLITLHEYYPFINFPTSDIVYDYAGDTQSRLEATRFQIMYWRTTAVDFYIQTLSDSPETFNQLPIWLQQSVNPDYGFRQKYETDLYDLDRLDHITEVPGKKFVYAHLMITHPEFAFAVNGELRDNNTESLAAYGDQVTYADQRILAIVKNILAQSKTPPIIILQGDHGYGLKGRGVEQFKILNAYYLPQGGGSAVYPSITPINTFRLILSRYFNQDYPLLPDRSIWINSDFPGGYQVEPGTCQP